MFKQLQSLFDHISISPTRTGPFPTLQNPYRILSDDVLFNICTNVTENSTRDALNMALAVSILVVSCVPDEIS